MRSSASTLFSYELDGGITSTLSRSATERRPKLLLRRLTGDQRKRRCSACQHQPVTMTPQEFDALPASIQRKYFSPKERIQIAQQAAHQMRQKKPTKGSWLEPATPTSPVRPSTSAGVISRRTPSSSSMKNVKLIQADQTDITEDQARWFLLLPDKVRRQHFSREEQIALMVRCKKKLEHVSPDLAADVYRRILSAPRDSTSILPKRVRPSTSDDTSSEDEDSFTASEDPSDTSHDNADWEVNVLKRYSKPIPLAPMTFTPEEMLHMTSIPPPPSEPSDRSSSFDRGSRKSFVRKRLLTPLPLPAPTLAPPIPPVPRLPGTIPLRQRALSYKRSLASIESLSDVSESNIEKKHFHDQDTRAKIRHMLASEQNFMEAIDHGFAPDADRKCSTSTDQDSDPDRPLLCHSEHEDDDAKSAETAGLRTPDYMSFRHTPLRSHSSDSGVDLPSTYTARPKTSDGSLCGSIRTHREMTIRMTLTRRDLQSPSPSPEEKLYSVQRFHNTGVAVEQVDPLALEPLVISDDASGAHGAFAVHEGGIPKGLKKVWRSLARH